jgi:DNA replication licensing factor MCM4
VQAYQEMRQLGTNKKMITATPRQLESLIRLSEAFAKMRLSNEVVVSDVEEAINLIKVATQQAATDPTTGLIDMDIITTGRTAATKIRTGKIAEQAKELMKANLSKYLRSTSVETFLIEYGKHYVDVEKVTVGEMLEALRLLQTEDVLVVYGQNKNNQMFKLQKELGNA